jgi:AraC-like DNA-binding protein
MGRGANPKLDRKEPLARFNVLRARDPDELRERLAPLYADRQQLYGLAHRQVSDVGALASPAGDRVHWRELGQTMTIEMLAPATETSARSLFATFRNSRGCSPMAYLRSVRLVRAREILSSPTSDTSVYAIAAKCGFISPNHFGKKYVSRFGASPSITLKRGKRELTRKR